MPRTPVSSPAPDKKSFPDNVNAASPSLRVAPPPHCLLAASAGTALRAGTQKVPSGGAGSMGKERQTVGPPPPPHPSWGNLEL